MVGNRRAVYYHASPPLRYDANHEGPAPPVLHRPAMLCLLGILMLCSACGDAGERLEEPSASGAPYAFDVPDAGFLLPNVLEEVSGLTMLDERHLGAVQDEDGIIFVRDVETAELVRT